jgi:hypothetical protein
MTVATEKDVIRDVLQFTYSVIGVVHKFIRFYPDL